MMILNCADSSEQEKPSALLGLRVHVSMRAATAGGLQYSRADRWVLEERLYCRRGKCNRSMGSVTTMMLRAAHRPRGRFDGGQVYSRLRVSNDNNEAHTPPPPPPHTHMLHRD